jgi:hypothetical protein
MTSAIDRFVHSTLEIDAIPATLEDKVGVGGTSNFGTSVQFSGSLFQFAGIVTTAVTIFVSACASDVYRCHPGIARVMPDIWHAKYSPLCPARWPHVPP